MNEYEVIYMDDKVRIIEAESYSTTKDGHMVRFYIGNQVSTSVNAASYKSIDYLGEV